MLDRGETLIVTLTAAGAVVGDVGVDATAATTTIVDEGMETVSVAATTASKVAEGGIAEFTVRLSGVAAADTVLAWSTAGVTAASGTDFTAVSGDSLTIAAGSISGTLSVTTSNDTLLEAEETFTVTITGTTLPSGVTLGTTSATGTIEDNETLMASVTAGSATVAEGGPASFAVTIAGGTSTEPVTVTYTVSGTADVNDDYTAPSGTLTLAAGVDGGTIEIVTGMDSVLDGGETLVVTLTGASTAAGAAEVGTPATATTAITDTGMATVSVAASTVTEGVTAEFTVTLSGAASSATVLGWRTAGVTATSGTDFTAVTSGALTIDAGDTTGTLSVATSQDDFAESTETFTVTITGTTLPSGVTLGTTSATGTIEDNETLMASVTAGSATVAEGGTASFAVALGGGTSTEAVTVTYTVSGTADVNDDYTAPSGTLTLAAGVDGGTIEIVTGMDSVLDGGETLVVTLTGATTAAGAAEVGTPASATVTITDTGTAMVSVAPASSTVVEGGTAAFTVTLSGAASSATVLGWSTDGVTATSGTDFTAVTSGALTIDAGDTTGTLSVATSQDDFAESTETFTVTITGTTLPSGVTLGTATATGTITDDDTRGVVVTPTNVQFLEESSDTYTVVLLSAPNDLVTVALTLTGDTSVTTDVPALEFDESNWDTPQTVTVYGMADADGDNDKATIDHTVSGGDYEAETAASVTVEVTDPHTVSSAVTLELDPAEVAESASAETVTVTASLNEAPRTEDTVVTVSVAGATATVATDFEAVEAFDLTITAGETSGTADFALTPVNDAVDEEDETVEVSGTTTAEELTVTPATVTIRDDDTRDVAVEPETLTFAEGETGEYTVVLTSQPTANVTVRLTVDGDDDVAADVTALTFTAANWSQEQTVTVSGAADQDAENDEATIDHDVKGGDYEAQAVTAASVTVTVNDGDQASSTVTLDLNPDEVAESSSGETVTVTARLDGAALAEATVVRVSVAGETAEAGADFAAVEAFDVKIEVGEKSGTADFELAPVDDAIDEADETLRVTGTTETEGLTVDDESAVLTIEDDDERGVTVS